MSTHTVPDASDRGRDAVAAFERARAEMIRSRRTATAIDITLFTLALAGSVWVGEVSIPKFVEGLPGIFNYIAGTLPTMRPGHLVEDVGEWYWAIGMWLGLLLDTVLIAFLATVIGAAIAFLGCFPASRNLMPIVWVYFLTRRLLEVARAVPELVYAMILVFAFGIGPFAGVVAIAVHTAGALGKLFSEVNENVDTKPVEGVRAAGADWFQTIRYAVVPQVLPNYASYTLLRFEINVRGAAVIGFVGAGGIGQELMFVIRQFIYADISAIVLLIILTVALIDIGCEKLRHRLIGAETMR